MDGDGSDVPLLSVYDYLLKFIIIGESGTAKTSLLHRFLHDDYKTDVSHTIGVAFSSTVLRLPSTVAPPAESSRPLREKRVKLQLWDTAGQERFKAVARSYYRGASGVILCYDVTRRSTFDTLETWLADARALASKEALIVLVGTMIDKEDEREVSASEGLRLARNEGLLFAEVSALTGQNVTQPFVLLAKAILLAIESGRIDPDSPGSGVSYGERALKRVSSWGESLKVGSSSVIGQTSRCCS